MAQRRSSLTRIQILMMRISTFLGKKWYSKEHGNEIFSIKLLIWGILGAYIALRIFVAVSLAFPSFP